MFAKLGLNCWSLILDFLGEDNWAALKVCRKMRQLMRGKIKPLPENTLRLKYLEDLIQAGRIESFRENFRGEFRPHIFRFSGFAKPEWS